MHNEVGTCAEILPMKALKVLITTIMILGGKKQNCLTYRFWRSLRTCGPSGNTVSLFGIEPGIKFLFILIPSIPGSEDAKLLAKQLCSK